MNPSASGRVGLFVPPTTMSDDDIIEHVKNSRDVKHIRLEHGVDIDRIVSALLDPHRQIRSFVCEKKHGPRWELVQAMLEQNPGIEQLVTYCPDRMFYIDFARFHGHSYGFHNLGLLRGTVAEIEHVFLGRELNKVMTMCTDEEYFRLLELTAGRLYYFSTGPKVDNEAMDSIYRSTSLRKLFLMCIEGSAEINLTKLLVLEYLEDLHLYLTSSTTLTFSVAETPQYSNIVKLEICCDSNINNKNLQTIWNMCPLLNHLKILAKNLTDNAFRGINKCEFIKHLDVSKCNPGFRNTFLRHVSRGCPRLEFLDLSDTAERIFYHISILKNCKYLKYLLLNNQVILDIYLIHLPSIIPNLIEIQLSRCENLSQDTLRQLKERMPFLQITTNL